MGCQGTGTISKSKALLPICLVTVGLFLIVSLPEYGLAHRLSVFAWVEGETVIVEGKLSGGKHLKKGDVYVYDGDGKLLLKTEVDNRGRATFPLPKDYETGLKIVIDAGEGHTSYWILTPLDIENQREKKE
jgi:nickel transport protein